MEVRSGCSRLCVSERCSLQLTGFQKLKLMEVEMSSFWWFLGGAFAMLALLVTMAVTRMRRRDSGNSRESVRENVVSVVGRNSQGE